MGPSECNHIQQRHASNRPEIDPKGVEEEVVDEAPLGAVRRVTFSLTFTQEDATGLAGVCARWHHGRRGNAGCNRSHDI